MANRFNAKPVQNYGVDPLPSGYPEGVTSNLVIPSVGLEDVDVSIFKLFDKDIPLSIGGIDGSNLTKVPVVFAGGEKWALLKRNRVLRDKNGSLILPLIVVGRSGFSQDLNSDITGRGINQRTGEIVVRRRLDKSDRGYQNLINRIFLKHQRGLSVTSLEADPGQLTTVRAVGDLSSDGIIEDGGLLLSDRMNNIYETIVIPSPQFYTSNYEVIIWTQYTHHMNQILETLISSFLPQTNGWRLETPKGYWFIASTSDDLYNAENNFDDMSQGERIIKYKFNIKVPAYILASSAPGVPIPVKRYVSSPEIKFETGISIGESIEQETIDDPLLGSDDPTLPIANDKVKNRDQRRNGKGRLYMTGEVIDQHDPALESIPRGRSVSQYKKITAQDSNGHVVTKLVRVANVNTQTGETVYASSNDLEGLTIVLIE